MSYSREQWRGDAIESVISGECRPTCGLRQDAQISRDLGVKRMSKRPESVLDTVDHIDSCIDVLVEEVVRLRAKVRT